MSKATTPDAATEPDPSTVEDEELSRANEAQVLPWHLGTRILPGRWISDVYAQRFVEAPADRPAKK